MTGLLVYLTSVALVGAAIIIFYSIASFSILYTGKEMPKESGWRSRSVAAEPMRADVFPTRGDPEPALPETNLSSSAAVQTLPSPAQDAATDHVRSSEGSGALPASEPPSLGGEASVTKDPLPSGTVSTTPEQRDRMFHEFETYHAKLGGNKLGPEEKTPEQHVRKFPEHQ
jgi:hypothetical protein